MIVFFTSFNYLPFFYDPTWSSSWCWHSLFFSVCVDTLFYAGVVVLCSGFFMLRSWLVTSLGDPGPPWGLLHGLVQSEQ
jgi:hypothetical protein